MVITFILPGISPWKPVGGFKVVYEYANHLSKRGHRINVVHPLILLRGKISIKKRVGIPLILGLNYLFGLPKVSWFNISPKVNMLVVPSLEERFIPNGDVIFATAWQTAEWVSKYNQNKGKKYYLIQHYEIWSGDEEKVRSTWKLPLKKIVISKWLKDIAEEMGEKIAGYVPNGLDFNHFWIKNPIENRNPKRVGMLYSKTVWKGSEDGIKALCLVRKQIPDLQGVFFGVSSRGKNVPRWVEYYQNPRPDKLLNIYNSCSIFVGSSWYEGWFLPGSEAMACGCAVVSTDCGGIREYAEHGVNALLSPPKDPQALAQNILRLLEDDDLRVRLAKAGYERIQKFTWGKAVDEFEKVISDQK